MKLKTFFCAALMALCTAACSDDDQAAASLAEQISGTYRGEIALSVMGKDQGAITAEITVTPESAAAVTLSLKGDPEAAGTMTIKQLLLTGVTVSAETGSTAVVLNKTIGEEGFTVQDSGTSTTWKFSAVTGKATGEGLTLKAVGQPGAMPMPITMTFTGTK